MKKMRLFVHSIGRLLNSIPQRIACGKSIGFVGSVLSTGSIMDRYLGYTKAMLRAGLPIRDDWRLEDRDDRGIFIPFSLPHEMPEAFVCNCDEVAYNLVETLKREGYRVPQDGAQTAYRTDGHRSRRIRKKRIDLTILSSKRAAARSFCAAALFL